MKNHQEIFEEAVQLGRAARSTNNVQIIWQEFAKKFEQLPDAFEVRTGKNFIGEISSVTIKAQDDERILALTTAVNDNVRVTNGAGDYEIMDTEETIKELGIFYGMYAPSGLGARRGARLDR